MGNGREKGDRFIFRGQRGAWIAFRSRKIYLSPYALALLAAALCSTAGCGAAVCKDAWLGPDKTAHFAAGFAVGAASSTLAGYSGLSPGAGAAVGLGVVAAAGAGKETADLKVSKTCWSWKDLVWDLIGGAVGTAVGTVASH